ncbi:MAG: hypothetical protein KJN92_03210 [Gemmatimonadetes bacterium]|nr:hypothetical protein [Gemmatimonadota bacterium]
MTGLLFLLWACGSDAETGGAAEFNDPAVMFSALEERLGSASSVHVDFHVTADGAIEVDLSGALRMTQEGITEISAHGLFAGEELQLALRTRGEDYEFGRLPDLTSGPTPEHLREALLIGLTRMGILHNLAMLSAGAPVDGAEGGVRQWAIVESLEFEGPEDEQGSTRVIGFAMKVGGVAAGSASLEIAREGHPVLRRQTVEFPDGTMHVVERYSSVSIVR